MVVICIPLMASNSIFSYLSVPAVPLLEIKPDIQSQAFILFFFGSYCLLACLFTFSLLPLPILVPPSLPPAFSIPSLPSFCY